MAIVGDHHQAPPVVREPSFEEGDGVEIEVVGRLVEHQQVVLGGEQAGERRTFGLPAGQPGRVGIEHVAHP